MVFGHRPRTFRPIRPKPLIPIFTLIFSPPSFLLTLPFSPTNKSFSPLFRNYIIVGFRLDHPIFCTIMATVIMHFPLLLELSPPFFKTIKAFAVFPRKRDFQPEKGENDREKPTLLKKDQTNCSSRKIHFLPGLNRFRQFLTISASGD